MPINTTNARRAMFIFGVLLSLLVSVTPALAENAGVLPPSASSQGMSLADWSAKWWQVVLTGATPEGPYFGSGSCTYLESDNVVLLEAGGGPTTFSCEVPSGTMLLTPIVTVECSNLEEGTIFYGATDADLHACVNQFSYENLHASVDGVEVPQLTQHIVESNAYDFGPLSANNVFGWPEGTIGRSVAKGVFLMMPPLSVGEHTIHISGDVPEIGLHGDATINITVVPRGEYGQ